MNDDIDPFAYLTDRRLIKYKCRNCNNTFRDNLPPTKCPHCGSYAIVTKPPRGGDELPPPYNNLGRVGKMLAV